MKKLLIALCAMMVMTNVVADDKLSALPLSSAATTISSDTLPYSNTNLSFITTYKLALWDLPNIPTFVTKFSLYAPLASPTFTGTVTAPTFIGALTGHASSDLASVNNLSDVNSATAALNNLLPSQGSSSGDCLGTNGTDASWVTCGSGGGGGTWGSITGTLSSQTDLQNALNLKANLASPTFTGTVTAPTFAGAVTGNASTASSLSQTITSGLPVIGNGTGVVAGTKSGNTTKFATTTGTLTSGDCVEIDASGNFIDNGAACGTGGGGGITALTGDVTASGTGSVAATLAATSNSTLTSLSGLTTASLLATIGTVSTGTWNGTKIGAAYGGTGIDSSGSTGIPSISSGTWSVDTTTGSGSVVLSTSPTLVTPALGTPASGVATNLTGTASGLTAGNVTTNANLTGPITSSGNTTSVASQSGTGSTFVMQSSPTLTTPNIGAATGASLSVSGQLTSTVSTGTAPLAVTSTTQVANLNAATAGSATNATNATNGATVATSTSASYFPLFAASSTNGNQPFNLGTGLSFNPSTNVLTTTTFAGALTGAASLNLLKSSNLSDVASATTAFGNISPLTTKGDTIIYSTSNARQGVPGDYGKLVPDSIQSNGWRAATYTQTDGHPTKNYIQYADFENGSTTGWTLGTTGTLTNGLPTGTPTFGSGASGNLSIAAVTSSPLSGTTSLSYISSAATTVGNMVASSAITIDASDQAKVLGIKFNYQAFSGGTNVNFSGTSSNSYAWAIWDATNSVWLPSTGNFCTIQGTGVGNCNGTVQTGASTASLRLVVYNANATAGAATLYLDDFFVGPQFSFSGYAGTDWVAYTPTFTGFGTVSSSTFYSRRVGGNLEVNGYFTSGTNTATQAQITMGYNGGNGNVTLDTSRITSGGNAVGMGATNSSVSTTYFANITVLSPLGAFNYVNIGFQSNTQQAISATNGNSFTNGSVITIHYSVPITGWSSNVSQSTDLDNRLVTMLATSSTTTVGTSASTIIQPTVVYDTTASYNASTGIYTCPATGYYAMAFGFASGTAPTGSVGNGVNANILKNGTAYIGLVNPILEVAGGVGINFSGAGDFQCNTNDQIALSMLRAAGIGSFAAGAGTSNWMSIKKYPGSPIVQSGESVNARYSFVGNTGLPTGTSENLSSTYATYTKVKDSHNAFNTSTGVYTVPISGTYHVSLRVTVINGNAATTGAIQATVTQAGSLSTFSTGLGAFAALNTGGAAVVSDDFYCQAGDTLTLSAVQANGATEAIYTGAGYSSFSIERVGN